MVKGLEHLMSEERLRAGIVQPTEKKTRGGSDQCLYVCDGGNKEDRTRFFSVVPTNRARGGGHKLKHRNYCLNIRKNFFKFKGD